MKDWLETLVAVLIGLAGGFVLGVLWSAYTFLICDV